MKKMLFALLLLMAVYVFASTVSGSEAYKSLRGDDVPASSNPPVSMDWKAEDASIARTFVHQPPLIPHDVEGMAVTTKKNDCMECHGVKDSGAPMPHASHFMDRDDKKTDTVSSQWYFCSQCHVGQVDAKPLVENTFQAK